MTLYPFYIHLLFLLYTHLARSQFEITLRSATLTPANTNLNGASIITHYQEVTTFNNTWNVDIQTQDKWQFILILDNSWGFDEDMYSSIDITFNSPYTATETSISEWLVIGITTDNVQFISSSISMNNIDHNKIYPQCDTSSTPTQTHGVGDIASLLSTDRSCDVAGGSCANWNDMLPINLPSNPNTFPFTLQLDNDPSTDTLHLSFSTKSYSTGFAQKCGYISASTNRGLKVYIGGDDPGQSFKIKSVQITALTKLPTMSNELPTISTKSPTVFPSKAPTVFPSKVPSDAPINLPTNTPINPPTVQPSLSPTIVPSISPTVVPSISPTVVPSLTPTVVPSITPTVVPSITPTVVPSITPTSRPTAIPSMIPSMIPTVSPTMSTTTNPTFLPSVSPSHASDGPSLMPTAPPSDSPTGTPTTLIPAANPTNIPTDFTTLNPSYSPSLLITMPPTFLPRFSPSNEESPVPTVTPTFDPSTTTISAFSSTINKAPNSINPTNEASILSTMLTSIYYTTLQPVSNPTSQSSNKLTTKPTSSIVVDNNIPMIETTTAIRQTLMIHQEKAIRYLNAVDNLLIIAASVFCLLLIVLLRIGYVQYKEYVKIITPRRSCSTNTQTVTPLKFEPVASSTLVDSYVIGVHLGDAQFDYTLLQKRDDDDEYDYDWDDNTFCELIETVCNVFNLGLNHFRLYELAEDIEQDINDIDDIMIAFDCSMGTEPHRFIDIYVQIMEDMDMDDTRKSETKDKAYSRYRKYTQTVTELEDTRFGHYIGSRSSSSVKDDNWDQITQHCRKIIKTTTENRPRYKAYKKLGFVEEKRGNMQKAMKYYRRALDEECDDDLEEKVLQLMDDSGVHLVGLCDPDPSKTFTNTFVPRRTPTISSMRKITNSATFEIYS